MKKTSSLAAITLAVTLLTAFTQTALTPTEIAKKATPAVVLIQGDEGRGQVQGTGFLISGDGEIVTAFHVIKGLRSAAIKLANGSGFGSVSTLATDDAKDLVIVKVDGFGLHISKWPTPIR